jgi:nucleotide-binding universal stress UspA family protein
MQPYHHILAAVDGSPPSQHALEQAIRFPGCRLTVAAVVPPLPPDLKDAGLEVESRLQAPYEQALARCRELVEARNLPLTTRLLKGEPHEAISAAARELGCDLVVIGKRGHDLPPGAHMGRVTERVIGFCPTDVLVVPARGTLSLDRLFLPVDGSRFSREASNRALFLAATDATLLVVAVLDAPPGFVSDVPDIARDLLHSLEELVAGVARQAADRSVSCETWVVVGPAYRTIVELAGEWGAGLIVMGSHGRTGLKRLLMGSVTERVVGQAPCPVLVVKADQKP